MYGDPINLTQGVSVIFMIWKFYYNFCNIFPIFTQNFLKIYLNFTQVLKITKNEYGFLYLHEFFTTRTWNNIHYRRTARNGWKNFNFRIEDAINIFWNQISHLFLTLIHFAHQDGLKFEENLHPPEKDTKIIIRLIYVIIFNFSGTRMWKFHENLKQPNPVPRISYSCFWRNVAANPKTSIIVHCSRISSKICWLRSTNPSGRFPSWC